MIVGFVLTPFLIGLPIMLVGWLILVYDTFRGFISWFVPKDTQKKIVKATLESYKPYMPAINTLLMLLWDMVKIAILITVAVVIVFVYLTKSSILK